MLPIHQSEPLQELEISPVKSSTLRRLIEYPDRRIKPIVYIMISSGIRLGSWDVLRWQHVEPITNENEEIIAAKLRVYAGDAEKYYTFITPEAYKALGGSGWASVLLTVPTDNNTL
jgi:hypothetical protein